MEKIIETKTKRWQPMEMDLELNSNWKTLRLDQARSNFLHMNLRIMSYLGKWETIKFNLTLFVDAFTTFIQCGAWNLQVRLEVDSKERKVGHKGEFGEDVANEKIGWKKRHIR
jgi:hypothetical protein